MRARARGFVGGVPRAHRALRGRLRQQGVPVHRRLPAVRRGGAVGRRRLGRRAAPRARGGLGPRAALHARQQQVAGRARLRDRERASATSWSTPSTRSSGCAGAAQRVLLRVTPGIEPSTHAYIQTGQVDSKFGFQIDEVRAARSRPAPPPGSSCAGCTPTSARRSSTSTCSRSSPSCSPAWATSRC